MCLISINSPTRFACRGIKQSPFLRTGIQNRTCPVFEWSKVGWFPMDWFSNAIQNWKFCLVFEWCQPFENMMAKTSGFQMSGFRIPLYLFFSDFRRSTGARSLPSNRSWPVLARFPSSVEWETSFPVVLKESHR